MRVTDPITKLIIAAIVFVSLCGFAFMMERIFKMYGLYFAVVVILIAGWLLYRLMFDTDVKAKLAEPPEPKEPPLPPAPAKAPAKPKIVFDSYTKCWFAIDPETGEKTLLRSDLEVEDSEVLPG